MAPNASRLNSNRLAIVYNAPKPHDAVHQCVCGRPEMQHPSNIIHINILVITAVISVLIELNIVIDTLVAVSALKRSASLYPEVAAETS